MQPDAAIRASAPGKVVLWGEYAVLTGAPAAVMAVDRYATVVLQPRADGWQFISHGFLTPGLHTAHAAFTGTPTAALVEAALRGWRYSAYPEPWAVSTDTRDFFHGPAKLGLGSSAAACVATAYALAHRLGRACTTEDATELHHRLQGKRGSGLDVATSVHGGVVRFQQGTATPMRWPNELSWRVIWTGTSATTARHIGLFEDWRARSGASRVLDRLGQASEALCEGASEERLVAYVAVLAELDAEAGLNIFGQEHQRLATIAARHDLVYKPCGAGGGDIGMAFGRDASALDGFQAEAAAARYVPLDLEIANHGVELCV